MLDFIINPLVQLILFLNNTIQSLGIPYHFGWAIIVLTIILKVVTLPLNLRQIRSMKAQQELQPRLAELQKKYGKDRERMAQAQMELYKEAGVNPLGGCLPLLVQLPILWALFGALQHRSLAEIPNASFFILSDLHCPSCAAWPANVGWLWPFPPAVGWNVALPYLILPVLLVGTQLIQQKMSTAAMPTAGGSQAQTMGTISIVFSLLFGYYSLIFPASLSIYYIVFNILGIVQQYFVAGWGGLRPQAAATTAGAANSSSKAMAPVQAEATQPSVTAKVVERSVSKTGDAPKRPRRRRK
ncbi:MAG: membrane protein insertase YidC [Anaerolineae bacterium]|nr:membrane protein insertase YidC [Anaerolineae bacterium]